MKQPSRRKFLDNAGKILAATGLMGIAANTAFEEAPMKNIFIHHVYFWLNNPGSAEDRAKLVEGLLKLAKVKTIRKFHIGQPAPSDREVVDGSYAISWMVIFKNKADQDSYQVDPIHLDFVKNYAHLWSKVIVYDSVDV